MIKNSSIFLCCLGAGGFIYAVNGPSSASGETVRAQGFIINMKGVPEIVSSFGSKASTHLGSPHSVAVTSNGSAIYIAEISPYRVVKLVRGKECSNFLFFDSIPHIEHTPTPFLIKGTPLKVALR